MHYLRPKEVNQMADTEEVYVNRIAICSRLDELFLSEKRDYAAETVLIEARRSIAIREMDKTIAVFGAKMKIRDIRRVFCDIEKMAITSFKSIY